MTDRPTLLQTFSFIKEAHAGQLYGTDPYWTHPMDVMDTGSQLFGEAFDEDAQQAALLHDVVEDTRYSLVDLTKLGYSMETVRAVDLVTKVKGMSYEDNIQRIVLSGDVRAMMVKYADNWVNFTGDKSSWDPERAERSNAKYAKSMTTLAAALAAHDIVDT